MKKLFLILLVLHISSTITAQWVTQNSGTLKNLASVYFVNANSGYAVGYDGTIIKTIDGGTNWLTLNSGSTELLSSVHFPSINKGYVVGGKTLLKTTDGGTNWTTQIIDSNYFLSSVFFTNPDTGFIVGASDDPGYFDGIILKTIDGGNIWTISFIYSVHYLQDVFFLSDDIGFVVGSIGGADPTGIILKTNNGGIDWVDISVASPLSSINMLTVDTGYAIGHDYIVIYKTNDGWGNWTSQYWGWQFISINFTSIDVGYALGHGYFGNHSILKTSDGGINWDIQDSTLTYQPTSMFFPSPDTGYIVGTLGTIYKTTNGGANVNNCLPEGIAFTSQSQIDSFQIYYPNCTEIEGDLVISGEYITNLNGLLGLASIGGDLRIHGANALTDLYGLDNISNIGGDLWMAYNDSLKTLNGLGSLTSVQGNLNIGDNNYTGQPWNPSLNSLTGLSNLSYVGGGVEISGCSALNSLSGLETLNYLEGDLVLIFNSITNFNGLNNLDSIGESLIIISNAITNLSGLENLTSIGNSLVINSNTSLIDVNALINLTEIDGALTIKQNWVLTSLSGLEKINSNTINNLTIEQNSALSNCKIKSICDYLLNPSGEISIWGNDTSCNSQQEVEEACESASIDEQGYMRSLTIYPNPSSTQITIELPTTPNKNTTLTIYNLNGQHLITEPLTEPPTMVDVSGLPSGVYFVKVIDDEKVMMGKVIKQ